jgi:hypothetical protein
MLFVASASTLRRPARGLGDLLERERIELRHNLSLESRLIAFVQDVRTPSCDCGSRRHDIARSFVGADANAGKVGKSRVTPTFP